MDDLEVMAARDADDEGPACGTDEARTSLNVTYSVSGVLQIHRSEHCCYRHIPAPAAVLPENADVEEVAIGDGVSETRFPLMAIAEDIEALLAGGDLALA